LKLFILAGEPSGDRIAADLVERIRAGTELTLTGVGGAELVGQGLRTLFPMRELSVMGRDILLRLPWLYFRAWQVARAIIRGKPDIVVFVDAQIFSAVVAGQVRKAGARMPILLYVAPSVWAWAPERAKRLKPVFDEVLAVLPFEPQVMADLDGPLTHYVGHPAVKRLKQRQTLPRTGPLLLLPGSREGELRRHLPLMRVVAERLSGHPKVSGIVVPTLSALHRRISEEVAEWQVPVRVVAGESERAGAFASAIAACSVMGTATLELALSGVPMIGTFVADKGQEQRWYKYSVKYASLPNHILGEALIPEVLFVEPDIEQLVAAVTALLDGDVAARQLDGFRRIRALMTEGMPGFPVVDPVERVLSHLPPSA
jgi:lipid-A-disaccharide synthase